ncbi:MAG: lysine--tRNA ligase, partial [Succinivibrio sp.]
MSQETQEQEKTENLNSVMQERREKLNALRQQGQAYPNDFRRNATSGDVRAKCGDKDEAAL